MCLGQTKVSWCERRIAPYCFFEIRNTLVDIGSTASSVQGKPAFEVTLVDFG